MSYILDALKKIERDRNKTRSDGRVNIAGDLFRERVQPNARPGVSRTVAIVAVAAVVAAGGTWFALTGRGPKHPAPVPPAAVAPPIPVTPPQPVPAPSAGTVPPAPVQTSPAPAPQHKVDAAPVQEPAVQRTAATRKRRAASTPKPVPAPVKPSGTVPTVAAPADIKLAGIAWQDERGDRRAVINGFLYKEGAIVAGAKITEIKSDRVRFTNPSGQFEVRLDGMLPAEVPR